MKCHARQATIVILFGNVFLFLLKFIIGIMTDSLALLSDATNSFIDILASIGILFAVKISMKKADKDHPFGHHRAQPIAGLSVAILTGILSFEIMRSSILELYQHETKDAFGVLPIIALLITILLKSIMSFYLDSVSRKSENPAIKASSIDCRNDVLISFVAMLGILGSNYGIYLLDSIAALVISFYILYSGYLIGMENIDYLMGKTPSKEMIKKIMDSVKHIHGVKGVNECKAHFVGNYIHVEIHIDVDKRLTTEKSHLIGENVEKEIEKIKSIDKAFVHIDPV